MDRRVVKRLLVRKMMIDRGEVEPTAAEISRTETPSKPFFANSAVESRKI